MCTVIVLKNVSDKFPLIVAANRDEHVARPSLPPQTKNINQTRTVYPVDALTGGTWIGSTTFGRVVALTNQDDMDIDMNKRSRGSLVKACLDAYDEGDVSGIVRSVLCREYNPFNLLFGNGRDLRLALVHHSTEEPVITNVYDGILIMTNDMSSDGRYARKENAALVRAMAINPDDSKDVIVKKLVNALSHHEISDDPHQSVCVHEGEDEWETRSSTIIMHESNGGYNGGMTYLHNEGHPCTAKTFSHDASRHVLDFKCL